MRFNIKFFLFALIIIFLLSLKPSSAEPSQVVNGGWLLDIAKNTLLNTEPWHSLKVSVETPLAPPDIIVPCSGKIELNGVLERAPSSVKDIAAITIEVKIDGKLYTRFDPSPYIDVSIITFAASSDIPRGSTISEKDITTQTVKIGSLPSTGLFNSIDEIIGKQAKIDIKSGRILSPSLFTLPLLVRRGENVTVSIPIGNIIITLTGIALDSGALGEQIRIKNPDSKAIINAIVCGEGMAEIFLSD